MTTRTAQIIVPAGSVTGTTRMRIARTGAKNNVFGFTYNPSYTHPACFTLQERTAGSNTYGEVEDYNVVLVAGNVNPQAPVTGIMPATGVMTTAAVLNGTVNANNNNMAVSFEYGLTTAYGSVANATPANVSGSAVTNVSVSVNGLTPNTTYHMRVKGITGTTPAIYSNDMTFKTASNSVGIEEMRNNQYLLQVYPNPNSGEFILNLEYFRLGKVKENLKISLFGIDGKKVYEQVTEESLITISIPDMRAGIYNLQVIGTSGELSNIKVIILNNR